MITHLISDIRIAWLASPLEAGSRVAMKKYIRS